MNDIQETIAANASWFGRDHYQQRHPSGTVCNIYSTRALLAALPANADHVARICGALRMKGDGDELDIPKPTAALGV
ncbi:MAG: hypothetical protein ACRC14_02615 [Paracoccaceae bacterium]